MTELDAAASLSSPSQSLKLESSPYNTSKKSRALSETNASESNTKNGLLGTGTGSGLDLSSTKSTTRRSGTKGRQASVCHITPSLVKECGVSFGVKLEDEEYCLLSVAYDALNEKVQKPWEARLDSSGKRYLYNCRTGLRAKYHPLEKQFPKAVSALRDQGYQDKNKGRTWLKLEDESGEFWYNFKTGDIVNAEGDGAPSESEAIQPCPQGMLPVFPTLEAGHANVKDFVNDIKVLSFKSWWYEDSEEPSLGNGSSAGGGLKKRYVTLEYDLSTKNFRIILEENVAVDLSDVQSKRKKPIECWDLYIGATLDILGKNTTLQQGTFETIQWLNHKAARLLAVKKELLQVLQKYRTASVPAAWSFALNNKPGCCSLRHLMYQIEQLKAELSKFRPSLVKTYTIEDVVKFDS